MLHPCRQYTARLRPHQTQRAQQQPGCGSRLPPHSSLAVQTTSRASLQTGPACDSCCYSPQHPGARTCSRTGVQATSVEVAGTEESTPAAEDAVPEWLQRTQLLVGSPGLAALRSQRVLLVGLGGVGSYAAEFLVRAGVGHLTIVDGDVVDVSNKNRQLHALDSTVGQAKSSVMADRLRGINPDLDLEVLHAFLDTETAQDLIWREGRSSGSSSSGSSTSDDSGRSRPDEATDSSSEQLEDDPEQQMHPGRDLRHGAEAAQFDYIVDCIDSVAPKKMLICAAREAGIKIISSMGAGGRMDPSRVRVVDLFHTFNDPFASNLRKGLRRLGVSSNVPVVWSDELVQQSSIALLTQRQRFKRSYYGTISYIPALFGLNIAAHIIREVLGVPAEQLLHVPVNPDVSGRKGGPAAAADPRGVHASRGKVTLSQSRNKRRRDKREGHTAGPHANPEPEGQLPSVAVSSLVLALEYGSGFEGEGI